MKTNSKRELSLLRLYALLFLLPLATVTSAQQQGVWEKMEVKERMTDVVAQKKKNPSFSFSAKSDDNGMNFEMSSVWANDKKTHTYRGHVAWAWTNLKGPGMLVPGEQVTIKGTISNLTSEPNAKICAFATFGTWGFMKPQSGKSGDECAKTNGSAVMTGTFTVPKQPGLNRDGTTNPYIHLTFSLHAGNESCFIERIISYKWKPVTGQTQPATQPPVITTAPPANLAAPQIYAEKTEYKVGETIVVKFKNLSEFKTNWIGIYGARAYHANEYIEWKYTNGQKEGVIEFKSPRYGAGDYMFRVYENNGYKLLAQSVSFKVVP